MKINQIKTGFLIMEKHKLNIKDPNTYTKPFVVFFTNIWNVIKGKPINWYTHSMSVVFIKNIPYIFEAISGGYKPMLLSDKIKERGINNLLLLIPQYAYSEELFMQSALKKQVLKYNIKGLIDEIPYQLSNERIWLGRKKINTATFCTEADTNNVFDSTGEQLFTNYYQIAPNDLFISKAFKHDIIEL